MTRPNWRKKEPFTNYMMCRGETVSALLELNTAQFPSHLFSPICSNPSPLTRGSLCSNHWCMLEPLESAEADMHMRLLKGVYCKHSENEYRGSPIAPLDRDRSSF